MSKKWLFVIILLIAVVGYAIASKMNPQIDEWVSQSIIGPLLTWLSGTATAITTSPFWATYIGPNIGWIGLGLGFIGGLWIMHWASQKKLPWQKATQPQFQPMGAPAPQVVYVQPPAASVTPQPTPQPTTSNPKQPEKEEATA